MRHQVCKGLEFIYQDKVTEEDFKMPLETTDEWTRIEEALLVTTACFYRRSCMAALFTATRNTQKLAL